MVHPINIKQSAIALIRGADLDVIIWGTPPSVLLRRVWKPNVWRQSEKRLTHKETMYEEVITVDGATEQRPLKPGWLELEAQDLIWFDGTGLVLRPRASANRRD